MSKYKPGDKVALNRERIWATVGTVGVVKEVHSSWDSDDMVCWDLSVDFRADDLKHRAMSTWLTKGLHFSDVTKVTTNTWTTAGEKQYHYSTAWDSSEPSVAEKYVTESESKLSANDEYYSQPGSFFDTRY